jgi:hypothetical protein
MSASRIRIFETHIHRCRITKGLSQVTLDSILRRKVDLLEKLGRDGDTACGTNSLQRRFVIQASIIHVICVCAVGVAIVVVLVRKIFLQWITVPVCTSLGIVFCRHLGHFRIRLGTASVAWE